MLTREFATDTSIPIPVDLPQSGMRRLLTRPLFWTGLGLLVGLLLFCFAGPLVYPKNPLTVHVAWFGHPPSWTLPLGADNLGRNELARMMAGGQQLIVVGLASAAMATAIGTAIGLISGFWGGIPDRILSWGMDVVLGIPQVLPLLLIVVLLHPDVVTITVVVALTTWPMVGRLVRAESLSTREREYVTAARSLGASGWRILLRHILPNLWGTILIAASNQVAITVLVVATASFLGLGLPPPWPNWPHMVASGTSDLLSGYWWLMLFPGLALVLLQLSVNFIAEAVRKLLAVQGGVR
ncbi:MAG: ABC transporter permease [Firmicutes bacterium]|nr:ABC transporter permease [Bacillota bacterium]